MKLITLPQEVNAAFTKSGALSVGAGCRGCSVENVFIKFRKVHKKTLVPESVY